MKLTLKVKKYKDQGDIAWEYNPLRNLKDKDDQITDFNVSNEKLNINLEKPIDIECQSSYDGSTNLIFNDDQNPPRIVNTRIALLENNRYKVINRNQIEQTNLYTEDKLDQQTRLFRNITRIPKLQFKNINYFGKLKGGNYIFYIKYSDCDYNETDLVAESGVISVFKGDTSKPSTCSGAYMDEITDKSIVLYLKNIDTSFNYINIYYSRTSCDRNGVVTTSFYKIKKVYEIENINQTLSINGFEELEEITEEDINKQYNYVESVKTQAQVQNMLFFANVTKLKDENTILKNLSLNIIAAEYQSEESIGYLEDYKIKKDNDASQAEYYSPYNIYYKLGYFPGELYRFGIVYIYNDDHLSPVYNLKGIDFNKVEAEDNIKRNFSKEEYKQILGISESPEDKNIEEGIINIENEDILDNSNLANTRGVFKFSKDSTVINYKNKSIHPIGLKFIVSNEIVKKLQELKIKGFYFVRQKRIPTFLFSGLSVGVENISGVPCLFKTNDSTKEDDYKKVFTESFVNSSRTLINSYESKIIESDKVNYSGLLSVDVKCDKQIQSLLNSDKYKLVKSVEFKDYNSKGRAYVVKTDDAEETLSSESNATLIYVPSETPQIIIDDNIYCTKAGLQEDVSQQVCFGSEDYESKNAKFVRGVFTDFIGSNIKLSNIAIYNVYIKNFSEVFNKEYFQIRIDDNSPYFAITDRFSVDATQEIDSDVEDINNADNNRIGISLVAFRGDCFTYTTTIRLQRNFTSQTVPTNDTIIDFNTWKDNFNGIRNTENWEDINLADLNAVQIGSWVTFKGLSNNNIGLRSIDNFNTDEIALMGTPRAFYPYYGMSVKASSKIPESDLYNFGYSTTLGFKRNYIWVEVPYEKDEFDTRIMFSDIQVDGDFKNSYKVFQALAYQDIDRQYGGIVKILPWENNLLTVFEHAIAIVPVNEKALVQTTTGQNIHMYGAGVLQKQITIITDMYGSIWKDSIIRTPRYVYGVDTYAKKIWRFSNNGLELISDFTIQRFLNDEINLKELEKTELLGTRNVKTHFNAYKNDVMFTFYNKDKIWNICYNEVRSMWVTRYSWTPLLSDNINNTYFSFDLLKSRIFSIINTNLRKKDDIIEIVNDPVNNINWNGTWTKKVSPTFMFNVKDYKSFNVNSLVITGYYWDGNQIQSKSLLNCKADEETYEFKDVKESWVTVHARNVLNVDPNNTTSDLSNEDDYQLELYKNYQKIETEEEFSVKFGDTPLEKYLYYTIDIEYTPYLIAALSHIAQGPEIDESNMENNRLVFGAKRSYTAGMVIPYESLEDFGMKELEEDWNNALLYSIFVHGRSNIIDEIDYFDEDETNQILPTRWYNKQEPFEFEFIVNEPKGIHKIFDNLVIISNNVEPNSIEIEITGDVYEFSKRAIYRNKTFEDKVEKESENVNFPSVYLKDKSKGYKTEVTWDPIRNEYYLNVHEDCLNIKEYGRRLGNIYYNEDAWYFQVQPIYYELKDSKNSESSLRTTRVRDKWAKVRVKYKGDKLVIITALQTLMTQSYA